MDNWWAATLGLQIARRPGLESQATRRFPFRSAPTRQPLTQEAASSFSLAHRSGPGDENSNFLVVGGPRVMPRRLFGSKRRGEQKCVIGEGEAMVSDGILGLEHRCARVCDRWTY